MRIGILDLLSAGVNGRWDQKVYNYLVTKQYANIMPQAISVWCRDLGHEVFYTIYLGNKDPKHLLPNDLDIVFISAYTQASALAYALAKLYRKEKTFTVIGGPHAKQFPEDCLRFFDIVVGDCDRALITEILSDIPRGEIITSGRTLNNIPGVAVSSSSNRWVLKFYEACKLDGVLRPNEGFSDSSAKPGGEILSGLSTSPMTGEIKFWKIIIEDSLKLIVEVNFTSGCLICQIDTRRYRGDEIALFIPLGQKNVVIILFFNV